MATTITNVPVVSLTCPGCDCRMCASDASRAIESLDGVRHVRVDRRRGEFVVRHDPALAGVDDIESCLTESGLDPA